MSAERDPRATRRLHIAVCQPASQEGRVERIARAGRVDDRRSRRGSLIHAVSLAGDAAILVQFDGDDVGLPAQNAQRFCRVSDLIECECRFRIRRVANAAGV